MKITLEQTYDYPEGANDRGVYSVEMTHAQTLTEAVELMEQVLRASGYFFKGHLEIVEEDDEEETKE